MTKATLPRGEAYEFLELGAHLERADTTARILAVEVPGLIDGRPGHASRTRAALEPAQVVRRVRGVPQGRRATSCARRACVEFLLLDRAFPRAVLLLPRAVA